MVHDPGTRAAHRSEVALATVHDTLDTLLDSLANGGVRDLTHEQMTGLVATARRAQARLESTVLTVVAEVDARGSHTHDGALTTGAWLRMATRSTPEESTATVRTGRVLRSGVLSGTATALADGDISGRHAQAIAKAAMDAPAGAIELIEPEALRAARTADVRAVVNLMRHFSHALDPDAADQAAVRRYERRGLTLAPTLDGSLAISGLADEVSGSIIATAVDTASPLVAGDTRTASQRRLDALALICRWFSESPDAPRTGGGGHPHVIVTVDDATLRRDTAAGTECDAGRGQRGSPGATLSWIGPIAGSSARRVACDAQVTTVRIGPDGEVSETRSERRFFTAAQRRAMIARDGDRCPWPWCDRPASWSDGHHLRFWGQGGPTTVANGALPCPGHHTMLHEGGWSAHRLPDGRYVVRRRDGHTIGPEDHPPGHSRPPPHRRL